MMSPMMIAENGPGDGHGRSSDTVVQIAGDLHAPGANHPLEGSTTPPGRSCAAIGTLDDRPGDHSGAGGRLRRRAARGGPACSTVTATGYASWRSTRTRLSR